LKALQRHWGMLVTAALIAALPLALPNNYYYDVAIRIGMNAATVVGLNLLIGYAGQISLGHAGFFGLGAYASAILTSRYGWPPVAAMFAAMAGVGVIAYVVARPILRLKGHYLAMATLGLGIIIYMVLVNESALTGGNDGMQVPPFSVLGMTLSDEPAWYWATGAVLLLAIAIANNIVDSPVGRALRALHGSEIAAQVTGVDTASYKVRIFVVSALFASFVGSMMAHYVGFITPQMSGFFHSIELVTMVVVGGMASTYGAVLGAMILTTLPQLLSRFEGFEMIAFGAILMLTMIFLPRGLLPTIASQLRKRQ
jgi:branched-chain amino acid transport system permease protein